MRTSTGISTEAVFILHNMVRKLRQTYAPEYLAAVYESLGPSFRSEEFADYKATRTETPQELLDQIPLVKRLLEALPAGSTSFTTIQGEKWLRNVAANPNADTLALAEQVRAAIQRLAS